MYSDNISILIKEKELLIKNRDNIKKHEKEENVDKKVNSEQSVDNTKQKTVEEIFL